MSPAGGIFNVLVAVVAYMMATAVAAKISLGYRR